MAFCRSPFEADVKNGRIEGKGIFTFADGSAYYLGGFKDGKFHGPGVVHFTVPPFGTYTAVWKEGVPTEGVYSFPDGLVYDPKDWDYCTPERDRRFYSERNGVPCGGSMGVVDATPVDELEKMFERLAERQASGGTQKR